MHHARPARLDCSTAQQNEGEESWVSKAPERLSRRCTSAWEDAGARGRCQKQEPQQTASVPGKGSSRSSSIQLLPTADTLHTEIRRGHIKLHVKYREPHVGKQLIDCACKQPACCRLPFRQARDAAQQQREPRDPTKILLINNSHG